MTESATSLTPPRPAASIVARAAGERLPTYVRREQARGITNAATTHQHRVLLETLWQSGGRVSEVLGVRSCDVDAAEGALMLENRKQKRGNRRKRIYVSPTWSRSSSCSAASAALATAASCLAQPRVDRRRCPQCARGTSLLTALAAAASTLRAGITYRARAANGSDFRHGAAVNQVQQGVPLSEVQQQLGHVRIDSTTIYTKLANPERRRVADRVAW
ncbi:MAG: site-specific integrase [Chloroflexi bacterium]|nr:site-specific integrase [Chloroflexota bacterium]